MGDRYEVEFREMAGAVAARFEARGFTTRIAFQSQGASAEPWLGPDLAETKEWRKIELGLICYQKSSNSKADHFNLKSSDAIVAFVAECKKNKKVQLCVYSAKREKNAVYGSSVIEDDAEEPVPKKPRVLLFIFIIYVFMIMHIFIIY
jgi:hypothetical protein